MVVDQPELGSKFKTPWSNFQAEAVNRAIESSNFKALGGRKGRGHPQRQG